MFKHYKDISDVVSLLAYCPAERSFLLNKESNGEFWLPSSKTEKNCWKMTVQKINFELFGIQNVCTPLRVYKIWLPNHCRGFVYHVVYKASIKADVKKLTKMKGVRSRLQWFSYSEMERQRAHGNLRSPELIAFAKIVVGEQTKDSQDSEIENGLLVEICEDNVIVGSEVAGGAVDLVTSHCQLLQAANYTKDDQIRLYREFVLMVYPALYMSSNAFMQFMVDLGWQRSQCQRLFRAADITARGGLSFMELILWAAATEPATQHDGISADIRCRYIFRYFDSNRDLKLEYDEFKELTAAARFALQMSVDSLSVARDADVCLKSLGLQPNCQVPLAEFLRAVNDLYFRGTCDIMRSPVSLIGYLADLHNQQLELDTSTSTQSQSVQATRTAAVTLSAIRLQPDRAASRREECDYDMAAYTVLVQKNRHHELFELKNFDESAVSSSTAKLLYTKCSASLLGPGTAPVETLTAIHYFAHPKVFKQSHRNNTSIGSTNNKSAYAWATIAEEATFGSLLLRLTQSVRNICAAEPRVLRLTSPVYVMGDLHGNLPALIAIEEAFWPNGIAIFPGKVMFLGDFVDRGPYGTELLGYLFAAKVQRPHAVLLIRGNHETREIQKMFSFYNECINKYGDTEGVKIWSAVNSVFDMLPLAAIVDNKVFCCHGGIPPPWVCPLVSSIDKVPLPLPRPAEQSTVAWELLWNDPIKRYKMTSTLALELAANEGFAANTRRGTGHFFDEMALDRFLIANQLSHVVRAHELFPNGFMCQFKGRLVTVFSSFRYCGGSNDCGVVLLEGGKLRLFRIVAD